MGQIKNIKLHIVTDIKVIEFTNMSENVEPRANEVSSNEPSCGVEKENKSPRKCHRRDRGPIRTDFAGGQFPTRLARFLPHNTEKDPEFDSIRDPHIPPNVWNAKNILFKNALEEERLRKEVLFKKELFRCELEKLNYQKELIMKHLERQTQTSAVSADSPRGLIKILLEKTADPDDTTFMVQDQSTLSTTT